MGISLKFAYRYEDGSFDVAQDVQMKHYGPNEPTQGERMMFLDGRYAKEVLQTLMDELWKEGIRPQEIGTAGHLAATQSHLSDMRSIVANKLGVELKP